MSGPFFRTIREMEAFYYPEVEIEDLLKTDAPILTSTTGVRNAIFGQKLWTWFTNQANTFGVLQKRPWEKSGYRAATVSATTGGIGINEASKIPDTVKPTFLEVTVPPQIVATAYDMSSTQLALAGKDDVVQWAETMQLMDETFLNSMDRDILANASGTTINNNFESIDRITGAKTGIDGSVVTGGHYDVYGLDRDGTTVNDSNLLHNSTVDRTLTLNLLDTVLQNVLPFADNHADVTGRVWITGYDTQERWQQLLQAQQRFTEGKFQTSVGGIQTADGAEGGFILAKYRGQPIFPDEHVSQDTISRVYNIDLNTLFVGVLKPMQHLESDDYQAIDKFAREGVDYMEGNLVCTKFKAQAQLRDLK